MSLITQPIALIAGRTVQVPTPQNIGQLTSVTIANLSSLQLVVTIGGNQFYQSPWNESRYDLEPSDRISAAPANTSGTAPSGAAAQLNCTWFVKGEKPEGTWPISLVANALAASISGGSITLDGQVPVVNGVPSPLAVGGSVTTTPTLAVTAPHTAQGVLAATGADQPLPVAPAARQGVFLQALKANAAPVYIGASGVSAATGLELLPGELIGPILIGTASLMSFVGTIGDTISVLAL